MTTRSESVRIPVDDEVIAGTFLEPSPRVPGILFVHGWGGSQRNDVARAKGIAALGCVCLTFDLRGHERTVEQQQAITREHSLRDLLAAYDQLASHPGTDPNAIAVVGSSYGGYLAAILTTLRPVRWLGLHVPAIYRDEDWHTPKRQLSRADLNAYRRVRLNPDENRALAACAAFHGDVLIVESEHDDFVPHTTIMSYRTAFLNSHSMTHRIMDGADHALSTPAMQQLYADILVNWITEMIVGVRVNQSAMRELFERDATRS